MVELIKIGGRYYLTSSIKDFKIEEESEHLKGRIRGIIATQEFKLPCHSEASRKLRDEIDERDRSDIEKYQERIDYLESNKINSKVVILVFLDKSYVISEPILYLGEDLIISSILSTKCKVLDLSNLEMSFDDSFEEH